MDQREVVVSRGLAADAFDAVLQLRRACEAADGSDLKFELNRATQDGADNTVLVLERGRLVGYAGVDAGHETEVCGAVHPQFRSYGIGRLLLDRALDIARGSRHDSVLVICEDAVPSAQAWLERRGATLATSEHRQVAALDAPVADGPSLLLREARPNDLPTVQHILSEGFHTPADANGDGAAGADAHALDETFVAEAGSDIVGTVRITAAPSRPMIYGFVIERTLRGRGLGTMMLRSVMQRVRESGAREVGLEVGTENLAALRLYAAFGFRTITTYRYMRLPL